MDTRNKLQEAQHFLDALRRAGDANQFNYILSAFLAAWRSVLDIMIYDLAEAWSLGLTREDRITDNEFLVAAKALNHVDALRFIGWWKQKRGALQRNPLWKKRTLIIHRGYPPTRRVYRIYILESVALSSTFTVSHAVESPEISEAPEGAIPATTPTSSASTEGAIPPTTRPPAAVPERTVEVRFADSPNVSVVAMCSQAYQEMDEIVREAEREFNIKL